MALSFSPSSSFPTIASLKSTKPNTNKFQITEKPITIFTRNALKFTNSTPKIPNSTFLTKASQEQENTSLASESETQKNPPEENRVEKDPSDGISELGMEIKKAMKEREQKEPDFLSGVAEEIREIEWPGFNKVLGTTGIVLGVMAGSSVVLLTVNAVLAELSDRVFAGKGIQDFFG
ncbi:Preprotein translocase subunit SECE1 [Forsythia ovata]|uniref:Preprotein translocase subunit SECE1 n=1 Tax=Forsythia ovata TaxID=205694 RepID=A0ABD1PKJ7_9LAMI